MDRNKFLQSSHVPETGHCSFPSPKRKVQILNPVVPPSACFLPISVTDLLHRGAVGSQFICASRKRSTMAFHGFLEEFQCRDLSTR
ncbi:hypothetical protein, partial [Cohaesibacter celericrescens]|uniref:hypothetical protein n=1 Tax=Cohaesibacter celericrescens TaxID=2067669 RepID=UPI004032B1C0